VFDHRSLAKRTLRELRIVRSLVHENILGIDRVIRPHHAAFSNIYMISELMQTDLACVIRSPQELTSDHVQFFIYQVLRGLKYIHSAGVIHRDLKPRNLLVNSNCDLKICDFGLARVDDPNHRDRCAMSNYIATRWYRAPEVIRGDKNYTTAVDMWSVGCQ
jgi:serine/threonine protein kinase